MFLQRRSWEDGGSVALAPPCANKDRKICNAVAEHIVGGPCLLQDVQKLANRLNREAAMIGSTLTESRFITLLFTQLVATCYFFHQTVWTHLGVLTVGVKRRG